MIILEATKGNVLTQSKDVPIESRVLTYKIYLAVNDSPDNWKEISEEEAEKIRSQQKADIESHLNNKIE